MPSVRRHLAPLALLAAAAAGCTATVTPPRDVGTPVRVYLLREARHLGLVVPAAGAGPEAAGFVEFGYGEWSWYALREDSFWRSFPTMLWPTAGTLGRRVHAQTSHAALRRHAARRGVELDAIDVDRGRLEALRRELEAAASGAARRVVYNTAYAMTFVPLDHVAGDWSGGYWFANTCADVAAGWLERLGCEVSWQPIRISLRVAAPADG